MAGATVATWVKVRTKNGLKSMPISLKDGGGNFIKGQTITESELREVLKKKGDRLSGGSSPSPPMVSINVDHGDRMGRLFLPDQVAKEFGLTDGSVIDQSKYVDVKKRDKEFSRTAQGNQSLATSTKEAETWQFGISEDELRGVIKKVPPMERQKVLSDWIKTHSDAGEARTLSVHEMSKPETFSSVKVGQIRYHFPSSDPSALDNVTKTINDVISKKIPDGLSKHTSNIYLANQKSGKDFYWEKVYGWEGFISAATGGDRSIVGYGGVSLTRGTIAHEMGHNLANSMYGSPTPPKGSKFASLTKRTKGEKIEKHPSNYGMINKAEDFAESVRLYIETPSAFRESHPKRYTIIKNLIETGSE